MTTLKRLARIATETLGGKPEAAAGALLEDYGRRLGHRPTPNEVAVLLAAIDALRDGVRRHAAPDGPAGAPTAAGEQRERCPGSDQMILPTATGVKHKCARCGVRVGERIVNGMRTTEEHERVVAPPHAGEE